jgi:hypothetical protein
MSACGTKRFRGEADIRRGAASTLSVATDPTETLAAKFCCDAQRGNSYNGVVSCNTRAEGSTHETA